MNARSLAAACSLAAAVVALTLVGAVSAQAPAAAPYSVVTRDGRRPLPARTIGGQEMFALDDLARLFELTLREDLAAGGLTVGTGAQSIILSSGQPLASVAGRLISLAAAPARDGRAWFVPVDFVPRALGPALGTRLDLRRASRLIVVGDTRLPQVTSRIDASGGAARLTLDVSPATSHTVLQEGQRIVIRFDADGLDTAMPASTVPDLIQALRPGEAPASLVVDLGPRAGSFRTSDAAGDRGAGRIVVDVSPQATEPAPGAQPPLPVPPPPVDAPPLLDLPATGSLRTIVIDPGHGGDEHGVRGANGTLEKTVTLGVARRLKAALESRLGLRVLLTREGDQTVGLDERAAIANNNKADVFISLHASASVRPALTGAEVFYLSLEEYGEEAQRVAHGDSEAVAVFGGGARDIEVIPWEMAQARYIDRSASLAQAAEGTLRAQVPMSPRAIQQAPFRVLVGANMPAILVEMGFLSNVQQERDLSTETFQNAVVQALVDAVVRFRDGATAAALPAPGAQVAPSGAPAGRRN